MTNISGNQIEFMSESSITREVWEAKRGDAVGIPWRMEKKYKKTRGALKIEQAGESRWKIVGEQKRERDLVWLVGWFVGFLTSSSTTRLYRGRVPRLPSVNFTCCHT